MTSPTEICAPCPFCGSSDTESRFIEQKFYAPEDEHEERARYRYRYFRFCNMCGCQGPQGNSPEEAWLLWNSRALCLTAEKLATLEARWRLEAIQAANAMNALCGGKGYSEQGATKMECADQLRDVMGRKE